MPPTVFEELVRLSQLSSMFARSAMERALRRAGIDPPSVTWREVETALPEIQRVLEPFMQGRTSEIVGNIGRAAKSALGR